MLLDISVVVPVYHGKEYINQIVRQLETAAKETKGKKLELLFINDAPDDPIEQDIKSDIISVRIFNTETNRGIHGARIRGLSYAQGKYIHFLDQDDEVFPGFYASQISKIGDADVIYCNGYADDNEIYNADRVLETSNDRERMLDRPPMISPGQALIKKNSIPVFWLDHVLKNSGSDDFMLWLCMVAENRKFAINRDKLYRHVSTGVNLSNDIYKSGLSDREMVDLLLENKLFSGSDAEMIKLIPDKQLNRKNSIQLKAQAAYSYLRQLLHYELNGKRFSSYFMEKGISSVCIYGAGNLGRSIKELLDSSGIRVDFFVDKNAHYIHTDIPIMTLEEVAEVPKCVLVSLVQSEDIIKSDLKDKFSAEVVTLKEIIETLK